MYRLFPGMGLAEEVERHGSKWFGKFAFCLHDDQSNPAEMMPPADLSLAHMLMLACEEGEFLAAANARRVRTDLWNGEWMRTLRAARIERERLGAAI